MTATDIGPITRPTRDPATPELSVVITRSEDDAAVARLLAELAVVTPLSYEVVLVDGAPHRDAGSQGKAIIAELRAATAPWAVVMARDHRYPPSLVPEMLDAARTADADLVVATAGAQAGRMSTVVTKLALAKRLLGISDPLSGFFAVRLDALDLDKLRPRGGNILLELLVRGAPGRAVEVRYPPVGASIRARREGIRFPRHLLSLWFDDAKGRAIAFGLVGLSGFLPNLAMLQLLTTSGVHYVPATIAATQVAILWNFTLLDRFVYGRRRHRRIAGRLARFLALNNADLLLRIPLLALLIGHTHLTVLSATVITLLLASVVRFVVTDRVIYLRR
jgi:dolichol-phosphate mannosyltransferase